MAKTVVITRARQDAAELAEALHERGLRTIHEALSDIFLKHTVRQELQQALDDGPDGVIVTSRYGVRALAALSEWRDPMLICVGEATLNAAQSAGFTRACSAGGTVSELVAYIADAYDSGSRFLYISAEHVRADLPTLLGMMEVRRLVAYEAQAAQTLSDTLAEQLKRQQIDAVTFLSQRSAQTFATLLAKADLGEAAPALHAFALSDAVAEPLAALPWRGLHIAQQPTLASLVDCVDNALRS